MSILTAPASGSPLPFPPRRFSVDEFHQMTQMGLFDGDDRVELLDGLVVTKMTKNPPHEFSLKQMDALLTGVLPPGWHTRPQLAITTADSEPEPDGAVARGENRDYSRRHPGPGDLALVAEIADSSLARDRIKAGIYARARIPVYWIVNLVDRQVEVYTDPTGPDADPRYRQRQDYRMGDHVPVVIDGREVGRIAVADILPDPG